MSKLLLYENKDLLNGRDRQLILISFVMVLLKFELDSKH